MLKTLHIALILSACIALFSHCDKQKVVGKKIQGEWELITFGKTNWEGLTEYASSPIGTFQFNELSSDSSAYSLVINADLTLSNGTIEQSGTYKITDKGDYMFLSTVDAQGTVSAYVKYRILTLNSTDLQVEFTSNDGYYHMMLFRKK